MQSICGVCGRIVTTYDTYMVFDNSFCSKNCRTYVIDIYKKKRKIWEKLNLNSVCVKNCVINLLLF